MPIRESEHPGSSSGGIDLTLEESGSVIALPHDPASELVFLVGHLLRRCCSICSCGLVHFLSASPVFRAPIRLGAATNAWPRPVRGKCSSDFGIHIAMHGIRPAFFPSHPICARSA
jgi:hypothetical protein